MPTKEAGSSQAAWALLTEGVTAARIEAHRLRAMVSRVLQLVETSEAKEHLYQVAGDVILMAPARLETLERHLDRTSYALSVLGEESLREMLPLYDRKVVDEAVERAKPLFGPGRTRSSERVAERYLQREADLNPPLGGGPCQVIDRVRKNVRHNPQVMQGLVDEVEEGFDLSNEQAGKIYRPITENLSPGLPYRTLLLTGHEQYRMDLRKITVAHVRDAAESFLRLNGDKKTQGATLTKWVAAALDKGDPIKWLDPKSKLEIVFREGGGGLVLITSYWKGRGNPSPPGDGGCDV